ncbi:MAG: 2-hydroxyglutaryl-CoA dehydratase [Papillibacter sp.]|nr:2-hydroxyglutaryl-CoA dehydratase [Papillibacter sp.]
MSEGIERIEFTKEMKKTYKILVPNMLHIHFRMLCNVFISYGYDMELLTNTDQSVIDEGLKYVHNDTCYPALLTIGQLISALKSGKYDLNRTAVVMSQTGGGCRASNYIHLLRKALKNAGMGQVPVISVNLAGLEKNSGFKITLPMLRKALAAVIYGDMLMLLSNQVKPYEVNKGESEALVDRWVKLLSDKFEHKKAVSSKEVNRILKEMVASFEKIETVKIKKVKVGIVGEIYLKYSALANNNLEAFLATQDCEVMIPGVLSFMLYSAGTRIDDNKLYGGGRLAKIGARLIMNYFLKFENYIQKALKDTKRFTAPAPFMHTRELVEPVIGHGCKMGEGWLLTAEMLELAEAGYENIIIVQPFGCLPNHIVGRGMIRRVMEVEPRSNIVSVDYDPGATKVNQENRIKLMLSVARERMAEKEAKPEEIYVGGIHNLASVK